MRSSAQRPVFPIHPDLVEDHAFRQGEGLSYIIHYKWLGIRTDVGEAEVTLDDGGERDGRHLLHPVAVGRTYRFWDVFSRSVTGTSPYSMRTVSDPCISTGISTKGNTQSGTTITGMTVPMQSAPR